MLTFARKRRCVLGNEVIRQCSMVRFRTSICLNRILTEVEIDAIRNAELIAQALDTPADKRTDAQKSDLFEHYLTEHDAEFPNLLQLLNH